MPTASPLRIILPPSGILAREIIHGREFEMDWGCDPYHEIFNVLHGRVTFHFGEGHEPLYIAEGGYCVVPVGIQHKIIDNASSTMLILCVSASTISLVKEREEVWSALSENAPWSATAVDGGMGRELNEHWKRLISFSQQRDTARNRLQCMAHLDACLLALDDLRTFDTAGDARSRIRKTMNMITERVDEHWSVERAANKAQMSSRRFTQLFREITGGTFVPWMQGLRVKEACRLLASGNFTIAGAAYSCGFEDISHFYRVFHKHCGRTPRQWVALKANES